MLSRLNKRWEIHAHIPEDIDQALADYPPFFRQILYARGVCDSRQALTFLNGDVENDHPFLLADMEDTVRRILWAIDHGELIAVYGDYDVDGVTATALMTQVLRQYGGAVIPYIPNRFEEGYGLNLEAVDSLAAQGVRLIITVDCGIRSPHEAKRAEELGIDMIISDHHQPGAELPEAFTVICPKRNECSYPDKNLSGVGLAYKIAQGMALRRPEAGISAENWLDLVALGTVADVAPLTGENRSLVRKGLQIMRTRMIQARPGLYSLANVAGVKVQKISAGDIAFMLGPRLNASGRLKTAEQSLNLLLADSIDVAGILSQELDNQNKERQSLTRKTVEVVTGTMQARGVEDILFAIDPQYNSGIVGLVASRLVETYYRPAIVGHVEDGVTRASCRSIPEFHITRALDQCADLLERHGGHALAAGFTARNENMSELIARLRGIAAYELNGLDLRPVLRADLEIPLAKFRGDYVETVLNYLEQLQPTGQGNPEAVFVSRDLEVVRTSTVGAEKQHLKLKVKAGNIIYDAIAFRQGHLAASLPKQVDLLYGLEMNEWGGYTSLQLNVRDIRPAGGPD